MHRQALLVAASRERLVTLLQERSSLQFSPALQQRAQGVDGGADLLATQQALFRSLVLAQQESRTQLGARRAQLARESEGQLASLTEQRAQGALVKQQTAQLEDLARQGYYPASSWPMRSASCTPASRRKPAAWPRSRACRRLPRGQCRAGPPRRRGPPRLAGRTAGGRAPGRPTRRPRHRAGTADPASPPRGAGRRRGGGAGRAHRGRCGAKPARPCWSWCRATTAGGGDRFALQAGEKLHAGQPADLVFTSLDRTRTRCCMARS